MLVALAAAISCGFVSAIPIPIPPVEFRTLSASTDVEIKAIDPNKTGNVSLVNQYTIRLDRLSSALHFILENHTTEWVKNVMNKDATISALVTALKATEKAVKPNKPPNCTAKPSSNHKRPPAWKFIKVGQFATCPDTGNRFKWCLHHGKQGSATSAIYMPEDHDHDA